MRPHVLLHIPVIHPLGNHAKLKQCWGKTLVAQNIFVLHSPAGDNRFVKILGKWFQWGIMRERVAGPRYPFHTFEVVGFVDTELSYGEGASAGIHCLPRISTGPGGDWAIRGTCDYKGQWFHFDI